MCAFISFISFAQFLFDLKLLMQAWLSSPCLSSSISHLGKREHRHTTVYLTAVMNYIAAHSLTFTMTVSGDMSRLHLVTVYLSLIPLHGGFLQLFFFILKLLNSV